MNAITKNKTAYWIFTVLGITPLLLSGLAFCTSPPPVIEGMTHLGYPMYLIRFLGVAKVLGALTIFIGKFPRLKEWAYAGLVFNLSGAAYSHLRSGDGPKAFVPLVILGFALLSYFYWKKLAKDAPSSVVL